VVTVVVSGGDAVSGEDIVKLYPAAEGLLGAKRVEDEKIAELLEWARTQKVAERLDYDLPNLLKVLSGKLRPSD
jgi:hypothetical protein